MSKPNPYLQHLKPTEDQSATGSTAKRIRVELSTTRSGRSGAAHGKEKKQNVKLSTKKNEFIFGNYHRYYSYRKTGDSDDGYLYGRIDSRIRCLQRDWFFGKDVLDIGCNAGLVSLDIAKLFQPTSIEGVDIDPTLISKARYNLSIARSRVKKMDSVVDFEYFPLSCPIIFEQHLGDKEDEVFSNIKFRCGDWVHEPEDLVEEKYDVILALSITKWIHLNNGDGGIRHFFNRCSQFLRPGGLFVLEPQAFEGYAKRAGYSLDIRNNYNAIEFYTKDFLHFLVKQVGFTLLETIEPPQEKEGFRRTLLILQKGSFI